MIVRNTHTKQSIYEDSRDYNDPQQKNIPSSCYHCKSLSIDYDEFRDEITCLDCGYVQRQALKDYTDNNGKYQMTSQEHKSLGC